MKGGKGQRRVELRTLEVRCPLISSRLVSFRERAYADATSFAQNIPPTPKFNISNCTISAFFFLLSSFFRRSRGRRKEG